MAAPRENVNLLFKLYCLAVMTLVAAAYTVALRYTRTSDGELYFSTTAMCITEVEQNPLLGFGAIAVAVLCSGFAGVYFEKVLKSLYTSTVVKYTDNIMKGFSAAAAIVLSTIASVMLFGLQITLTFALGTLLVCVSIYLYGLPRQDTTSIQQGETDSKERVIGV
ncbi:hypothetical protein FD755_005892 [Muntiacus reevesi]|uniref:Uncharacterized protein n=1 Tax=Muntiacus reevesi TaxID=9886 RepID=A0A5J5MV60_MUNRE|nr:hypothetical protein FD755_005892 [Muntiacus reevesi]